MIEIFIVIVAIMMFFETYETVHDLKLKHKNIFFPIILNTQSESILSKIVPVVPLLEPESRGPKFYENSGKYILDKCAKTLKDNDGIYWYKDMDIDCMDTLRKLIYISDNLGCMISYTFVNSPYEVRNILDKQILEIVNKNLSKNIELKDLNYRINLTLSLIDVNINKDSHLIELPTLTYVYSDTYRKEYGIYM